MAQQRPCTRSHSGFLKAEATLDSSQMSCPTLSIELCQYMRGRLRKCPWNTNQVGGLGLELEHASIYPSNCSRLARSSSVVAKSVPSMLELLKVKMSLSC